MANKEQQLFELLTPYVEKAGYECVDTTFQKTGPDWILTVYIDNKEEGEGVSLDDCEKVSRILDPILDEKDPIEQSYFLEVSSPGIDRPFKRERDWQKAIGKKIEGKFFEKKNGSKNFTGVLKESTEDAIVLETEAGDVEYLKKDIAKAAPVVEF